MATLARWFGYARFRPGQLDVVTAVLAGRDALVVIPTGGGKSLCYQVPALARGGLTVVVSPLISLMKDQVDALARRGIPATYINSSIPPVEQHERMVRAARGEVRLLYAAPERLDHGGALRRLREIGVRLLAVDEAHCISEWGHEFRPSYRRIAAARRALGEPPTIALTATATPPVRADIRRQLALRDPVVVVTGFDRSNLIWRVHRVKRAADKPVPLLSLARVGHGSAIVYASTRRDVERVARLLRDARIPAHAYHAGLEPARRRAVQERFLAGELRVIAATNAFGMGIDKPDVRRVIHYAMPSSLEAYYQEAGRAGRDGEPSECILVHAFADRFTHEYFIRAALPGRDVIERVHRVLAAAAGDDGIVTVAMETLATAAGVSVREAAGASALLVRLGGGRIVGKDTADITVLATAERLRGETAGDPIAAELAAILRRCTATPASIRLDAMPPGFGGAAAIARLLDDLQRRQLLMWRRRGAGLRVPDLAAMDWDALDRRRAAERARLDAMQGYVYTRRCRRSYVLRYFGDPSAATSCMACDNCTSN